MKICSKCKLEKPFKSFAKDKYMKSGYYSSCRECYKAWREVNKEKELKRHKIYYWANAQKERDRNKLYYQKTQAKKKKLKQCGKCKSYFSPEDLIDFGPLYCRKDYSIACGMDERTAGVFKRLKTKKVKVDDTEENKERREYMQKRKEKTLEEIAFSKFGM